MRKLLIAAPSTLLAMLLLAGPASAHAVFVGAPSGVPAGSEATLTMNVPHERDDTTFNVDVVIAMPVGWRPLSCAAKATWTCTLGVSSDRQTVHFTKAAGAAAAEDEAFTFTARAGTTVGTFPFPTVQTYNTDEVVRWIDAPGGGQPAPRLATLAAAEQPATTAPTTTVAHSATPTSATPAPTAVPTTAVSTTAVPTTAVSTTAVPTTAVSTTAVSTTAAPAPTSSTSSTPSLTAASGSGAAAADDASGDDGGSGATIAIVVVVLVALASGGVVAARRLSRRSAADGG